MTLNELFAASWNGFPEVESLVPVPRPVCTKPNCNCLEAEEARTGGPVKSYPCLADNHQDSEKMKTGTSAGPAEWLAKFNELTEMKKKNGLH